MAKQYSADFSFYVQLQYYYRQNKGKIRRAYKDLTRKFLDYNDKEVNNNAFLRKPQFEALEMYVFIKEFMDNSQVYKMFELWRKREDVFSDASYYSVNKNGQIRLFDEITEKQTSDIFKAMKGVSEAYPNYIYALAMGLGKTILMATCIFYEFLLSNKYPKDERFCHNALVFAPDKTVLQSLKEIVTFDKTLVVPPEYARVLDANMKVHFLDDKSTTLNTLDDSDFNIIISNTQKIIVKKKHVKSTPADTLFGTSSLLSAVYGEDDLQDDADLMFNQRFKKLCRLSRIGVYVDEAHHLFGGDLEKSLRKNAAETSLRSTINLLADDLARHGTTVVGCYNYTGTPYVKNHVLPEVVYAYGLKESIANGYLKDAEINGYANVKSTEFLREIIKDFWSKYGENTYEGLLPKMAIFAARVEEATNEVRPVVEEILEELGIPTSKILVNVGDSAVTSNDAIRDFNNLDVVGTEGNQKQFIILCEKGREGWNCRSLFSVALFRSPKSRVFVLQATMRCLRKITEEQQTAMVYLSKENYDILNDELNNNFRMEIKDMKDPSASKKQKYQVRVVPPPKYITVKAIKHIYSLEEKVYSSPIDFELDSLDLEKYKAVVYTKEGLTLDMSAKERNVDDMRDRVTYSFFSITGEIARYLNVSCILISKILTESVDSVDKILAYVNRYNDILNDVIIPKIFKTLFEVKSKVETEEKQLCLLREPQNAGYYEFSADPDLVIRKDDATMAKYASRSFHADTYCFDSKPEKECFLQYITNEKKVQEVYFTGMFTSNQGDLSIQYYDPESGRARRYYPDFLAKMVDGAYRLIEVKGDNMIDDIVVQAKKDAAKEVAVESHMEYIMYAGKRVMSENILETEEQ